jgi:hypothetical protein
VKRRELNSLRCSAAWPLAGRVQQPGKIYRVGLLSPIQVGPVDARRTTLLTVLAARGGTCWSRNSVTTQSGSSIPAACPLAIAQASCFTGGRG